MSLMHSLGAALVGSALCSLTGCIQTPTMLNEGCDSAEPRSGLYEVTGRNCENPLQDTDYCPLTQYLEIAPSGMFEIADGPRVIVFWYAETRESAEYANEIRVLRGRGECDGRYRLQKDADGEAWMKLEHGLPVEYGFVGYTQHTPPKLLFRMQLWLRPVTKTPELAERLKNEGD
jgi:hypothetical protein